jgi:hypothetical protein
MENKDREEIVKINNQNVTELIREMARFEYHARYHHNHAHEIPVDITFVSPQTAFVTCTHKHDRDEK